MLTENKRYIVNVKKNFFHVTMTTKRLHMTRGKEKKESKVEIIYFIRCMLKLLHQRSNHPTMNESLIAL